MSHKALRFLIRDTAKSLADNIQFGYGRGSDFNLIRDKRYPYIWLDPLEAAGSFSDNNSHDFTKTWNANMVFYKLDESDSTEVQYSAILDETDLLVDQFIRKLNQFSEAQEELGNLTTQEITITSVVQTPIIKVMADYMTGHTLSFSVTVPDKFDYCTLYDS